MIGGLIDDEQEGFRAGMGCVGQIFTLKKIGEKVREKKHSVYGFHRFGESIWSCLLDCSMYMWMG